MDAQRRHEQDVAGRGFRVQIIFSKKLPPFSTFASYNKNENRLKMEVNHNEFWDVAYRTNAPALLGVLRRYVKELNVAQDLLHEVFVTAMDKYDGYTGKGSFEGWLYRIAVNTALMHLRNERDTLVETRHATSLLSVIDDDDDNSEQTDNARTTIESAGFTSEELLSAIDRLPEHHKLVFNMYVMDDFSHKQIGTELNISPGTSKSHLARARKKIQQFLYDDALNKKKKKDKRWASAFLLLFPAKTHYIDRLFREGLSDFKIPPTGGAEFLSTAIEQHAASVASTATQSAVSVATQTISTTAFWGSKLSFIAACCGTAAVTGSICWLSMSENSPLNRDYERMNSEVIVIDSLMYSPNPIEENDSIFDSGIYDGRDGARPVFTDSVTANANEDGARPVSTETEKPIAPVVVKKQIIQHQTVVVRDTIYIIE